MPLDLSGKKVRLRALELRDIDAIWQAYQDFDLQLSTDGDAPPMSDVQTRAFWETIIANPGSDLRYFAIEPLADGYSGKFVGACSLQHIDLRNRNAELGIWLTAPDFRGLGYGGDAVQILLHYAFEVVRLDKVGLGVYDLNQAGLRSYERVGFRYEGRLRQMIFYEGRYWDEWLMRVLRSEWERYTQPPTDGLRLYHPADLDAAVRLIQHLSPTPDTETARAILRRWWRQIDREVYAFQVEGILVGLLTLDNDTHRVLDQLIDQDYQQPVLALAKP